MVSHIGGHHRSLRDNGMWCFNVLCEYSRLSQDRVRFILHTESDAYITLDTSTDGLKSLEMMRIMTDSHLMYRNRDLIDSMHVIIYYTSTAMIHDSTLHACIN